MNPKETNAYAILYQFKCDESRPSCKNCIRHSVECDLAQKPSEPSSSSRANRGQSSTANTPSPVVGHHVEAPRDPLALNMVDLELLHNFSTSTCYTLSNNPTIRALWRLTVPKIALMYDFVMRGLLAVSALHLAHFKPERKGYYVSHAMAHHSAALPVAASIVSNLTPENSDAFYLFSAFTCYFAMSSPRKQGDLLFAGEEGVAEWIHLFRGTRAIISQSHATLHQGALGPMFELGRRRAELRDTNMSENENLKDLTNYLLEADLDPDTLEVYSKTVDELRKSFITIYGRDVEDCEPMDAFIWIFRCPDLYLQYISQSEPIALVILAYYSVLLKHLNSKWWMEGWGTHLISRIYSKLDEHHRLKIWWPVQELGWIPD